MTMAMGLDVRSLRCISIVLVICNMFVFLTGGFLIFHTYGLCRLPFVVVSVAAFLRILVMIQTAIAQDAAARLILDDTSDLVIRLHRRARYKKWLWWSRCSAVVIILQFLSAIYLVLKSADYFSKDTTTSTHCLLELKLSSDWWNHKLLSLFMIVVCSIAILQCFTGSDVLKWRSFYETHDHAWRCHYSEMFDNSIRETLCCLGRVKYLTALDEDEVYSVARLLGDLVAYRASGTGHMELLAALALLQSNGKSSETYELSIEAPEMRIREAAALHKFAEAAYTGPLLDVGRNPFIFPCAWLYRQGILSPWARNRRPVLDGDNWWRGHAAAFLKYVNLPPEVLRHGRVKQVKCEAAYFIVVLHHLQSVIIAIRGTETPEDLITDGLCKECTLSPEDLAGLINCNHIQSDMKNNVASSFPHYGHSGIVEAAREVFMQIEGNPEEHDSESHGFLSKLLGVGCECFGYNVRIVGHSLGGAIAALLGLQLYNRYPNLHVYAYGPLPCVDFVVANACSEFVTSIIFGNEFSSRLSIGSIMRLRAAAITSLSQDPKADSAMIFRLARRFLYLSKYQRNRTEAENESNYYSGAIVQENLNHPFCRSQCEIDNKGSNGQVQEVSLWTGTTKSDLLVTADDGNNEHEELSLWTESRASDHIVEIDSAEFMNPFAVDANPIDDPVSQFIDTVPNSENQSAGDPQEMYLPGFVIHIVPEQKRSQTDLKIAWRMQERGKCYRAYIANRESFKDIIVSPSMFLDHLPWRCHDALQKILKAQTAKDRGMEPHII
ncbi:Fungal lipase-like domain [Sesbania bispinosa]|nr:Fungal lipase-like domain [Sesbania bispinosa]